MSNAKLPAFVLAKSTNPHNDGRYGRAGLRFTREWRVLKLGDAFDAETSTITPEQHALLDKDTLIVLKPASEDDAKAYEAELAAHGTNKDAVIETLRTKNADLEARLMKLELMMAKDEKKNPPAKG